MAENRCVACGTVIPEGRQVCPHCEAGGSCTSVIVSYDCSHGKDESFMLVGRKQPRKPVEVINAIVGAEADDIWRRLTVRKEDQ